MVYGPKDKCGSAGGIGGIMTVSELCRKYEITQTLFYIRKDKLLKESPSIFDNRGRKTTRKERSNFPILRTLGILGIQNSWFYDQISFSAILAGRFNPFAIKN